MSKLFVQNHLQIRMAKLRSSLYVMCNFQSLSYTSYLCKKKSKSEPIGGETEHKNEKNEIRDNFQFCLATPCTITEVAELRSQDDSDRK